jgi:hypothetical protein
MFIHADLTDGRFARSLGFEDDLIDIFISHIQALRESFTGRLIFSSQNDAAKVKEDGAQSHLRLVFLAVDFFFAAGFLTVFLTGFLFADDVLAGFFLTAAFFFGAGLAFLGAAFFADAGFITGAGIPVGDDTGIAGAGTDGLCGGSSSAGG